MGISGTGPSQTLSRSILASRIIIHSKYMKVEPISGLFHWFWAKIRQERARAYFSTSSFNILKDQAHLVPQRPRRNLTKAEFWRFGAYVRSTNNSHSDPVPSETYSIVKRHFETMILVPLHRRIYRKSRRNTWNFWNGSLQTWFRGISSSVNPKKIIFLKSSENSPEKLCFWYFSAHYNHFWI